MLLIAANKCVHHLRTTVYITVNIVSMLWTYIDCVINDNVLVLRSYYYVYLVVACGCPRIDFEEGEENGQSSM